MVKAPGESRGIFDFVFIHNEGLWFLRLAVIALISIW